MFKAFTNIFSTDVLLDDLIRIIGDATDLNVADTLKHSIVHGDKDTTIELELPGIDKAGLNIKTIRDHDILSITGKTRRGKEFTKKFWVPDADYEKITAKFNDGLLKIIIPKKEKIENEIKIE